MMEKVSSFLFSGTNFNKKKFAGDFARFQEKKESDDMTSDLSLVEIGKPEPEERAASVKKRKRKSTDSETVEGFTVFKTSKKAPPAVSKDADERHEDELSNTKKELYRQMEKDALSRKKYNIHVSGNNVPSPLKDFAELSSRFGCGSYILRNLAELGFKEPTPIQRQAIPVLLSGRECFACASTGSGKTFAFVCPMLMKLKHASTDGIRAVILCPTRELAAQTTRECKKLAKGKKFRIKLMTKELARSADFSKLHCDILISTPLRLQLAIQKKKIDLSRCMLIDYLISELNLSW